MSLDVDLGRVAELLRARRRTLQPEDVGFARGRRRRTPGLRREEVAELCSISTTYYSRLERSRGSRATGPRPSPATLAGIARGLRFTREERDALFAAAGYAAGNDVGYAHVDPGVMLLLDRLADTPAHSVGPIGEVLWQTRASKALIGDLSRHTGRARSGYYRWFLDPGERQRYAPIDHRSISVEIAADLRRAQSSTRVSQSVTDLIIVLLSRSEEFATLWRRDDLREQPFTIEPRCFIHPSLGPLELQRKVLTLTDRSQRVVIYHATPGSADETTLQLLSVIGNHRFDC
ncbi:helix-turn-helix transcriptional regulator [Mycolicibacterium canariasense]|uniref:helix-turn-helix transcriptional regulator n=1 Tax=Mycolicibacterium canariasense TaxID=228230 RepID=UPI0007EC16F1|nr:helix-turn-helix transcriptional regulator [Mycolicibacterium canariasense]MCV7208067.1 helix-turn-helix domain-containing protein [Mycolicibacterium canariasense]